MLTSELLNIEPHPFTAGHYGDVYHGTLDDLSVCIKRVRVYAEDPQKAAKVCFQRHHLPYLPSTARSAELLPRGSNVETLDAPKRITPARCYYRWLPTHFELDAWRAPAGLHQEEL